MNASFQIVITNSINGSSIIGFQDFITLEKDKFKMLDSILEKTNILIEEIVSGHCLFYFNLYTFGVI